MDLFSRLRCIYAFVKPNEHLPERRHLDSGGDYFVQGRRRLVRLHEKGGKEHDVPCHHNLDH